MHASGFAHAPISRILVYSTVIASVTATATDTKFYFPLNIDLHVLRYGQWWRLLTWQLCYTNSTEVLFAAMTFYQLRVIERLWGSRKLLSFIITTALFNTLLPPLLLLLLKPLSLGQLEYLPSGPTTLAFSLLAQYHAMVPYLYRYKISSSSSTTASTQAVELGSSKGLELTSKSWSYLLPAQLAFSQLPGSLLPALIGWCVGYAWRLGVLPVSEWRWRGSVPGRTGRLSDGPASTSTTT